MATDPSGGEVWAVVLAAGRGQRFGALKQFERLGGERLVDRAVGLARPHVTGIVLALPPGIEWNGPPVDVVVAGGDSHADSTRAALAALPRSADTVMITAPSHPLIESELFTSVLAALAAPGVDAAVPLLALADAVKVTEQGQVRSVSTAQRPSVAQLPFAIRRAVLDRAVEQSPEFVEELAAVEELGGRIVAVDGSPANLHVATRADFALAELILRHR